MTRTENNGHYFVEKYRDPTAGEAIERVDREIKNKERIEAMHKNSIEIPLPLADMNEYTNAQRANKYMGAKIKRENTEKCAIYTTIAAKRGAVFTYPCALKFTWIIATKRKDPDNIASSKKFILDGMQDAGFLPNDSFKYITGLRDVFVVDKGREPCVIVEMDKK